MIASIIDTRLQHRAGAGQRRLALEHRAVERPQLPRRGPRRVPQLVLHFSDTSCKKKNSQLRVSSSIFSGQRPQLPRRGRGPRRVPQLVLKSREKIECSGVCHYSAFEPAQAAAASQTRKGSDLSLPSFSLPHARALASGSRMAAHAGESLAGRSKPRCSISLVMKALGSCRAAR